jgi:4-diphosphocytidyl-2-C-methyl-D-erythritol kinase
MNPGLDEPPGSASARGVTVALARAKLNPFLRVLRRRDDAYHELETLILPISLTDRLEVHAASDLVRFETLALQLDVSGDPELIAGVPQDESNLILRAAVVLADATGVRGFADFLLEKRIPAAAGLGGGSADAAATLRVLNELWGCGLGEDALRDLGASVGSDVPALLGGGAWLASGRGERLEPVVVKPQRWRLITFSFGVPTGDAYGWWDEDGGGTGPDPAPIVSAAEGGDPSVLGGLLFNDLEAPVIRRHPEVGLAKRRLLAAGALGAVMCGSGPTVAGLLPPEGLAASDGIEVGS